MTDAITWGEPIEVDGQRPAWLTDGQPALYQISGCGSSCWHPTSAAGEGCSIFTAIRLPADHPAYQVIAWNKANPDAQPFEPWPGGDDAPGDWDGDRAAILYRDGQVGGSRSPNTWGHQPEYAAYCDIIGYRRRATAQLPGAITADTVTIPRMTEAEAYEFVKFPLTTDNEGWAANTTQIRAAVTTMKALGLNLPEPTPAERMATALGISPETATAALAWIDANPK